MEKIEAKYHFEGRKKRGGKHPRGRTLNYSHAGLKLGSAPCAPECAAVVAIAPPSEALEEVELPTTRKEEGILGGIR